MARMRTIDEASAWLHETDPGCSLTKTALRRLIVTGVISSVKIGSKYLVSLENLEEFLMSGNDMPQTVNAHTSGIRPATM